MVLHMDAIRAHTDSHLSVRTPDIAMKRHWFDIVYPWAEMEVLQLTANVGGYPVSQLEYLSRRKARI